MHVDAVLLAVVVVGLMDGSVVDVHGGPVGVGEAFVGLGPHVVSLLSNVIAAGPVIKSTQLWGRGIMIIIIKIIMIIMIMIILVIIIIMIIIILTITIILTMIIMMMIMKIIVLSIIIILSRISLLSSSSSSSSSFQ